jgi:hypothetical protein
MERISREDFLEKLQPVLDLFGLDITPRDVMGFRWVPHGEGVGTWADALEVTVKAKNSQGKMSGTVTHTRMVGPVYDVA